MWRRAARCRQLQPPGAQLRHRNDIRGRLADRLPGCEVITPGGNWSSTLRNKHEENTDVETQLEEIYYFEIADSSAGTPGFGYHRVYGTPQRPIEVLEEVRSANVVGSGPARLSRSVDAAPPATTLYYLNVMAGSARTGLG